MRMHTTTNEYIVRHLLTAEQLASSLLQQREVTDYDEDLDGDMVVCGTYSVWITSDGEEFDQYTEALTHEIRWLQTPVRLEDHLDMTSVDFFESCTGICLPWHQRFQLRFLSQWWSMMRRVNPMMRAADLWESIYKQRF